MNLYEMTTELRDALEEMDDAGIPEAIQIDTMAWPRQQIEEKALRIIRLIGELQAQSTAMRDAATRMRARSDAVQKKGERLREYLEMCLRVAQINSVEDAEVSGKFRKLPDLLVVDEHELPDAYWHETVSRSYDKRQLREAAKKDRVPGVALVPQPAKLSIKA